MNTIINAVKFKADEKLEKFINDKVGKLDRMIDNALGCEVTLKVTKQADTFEQAVADGIDTLKVQIEKYKNA